jgi:hypothetical protein
LFLNVNRASTGDAACNNLPFHPPGAWASSRSAW